MGAIYLGLQSGPGGFARRVAIKRAFASASRSAPLRESILNEARLGSLVRHPNVVSINDVEEVGDGELLLVMDYIDGGSLSQLINGQQLPLGIALRVILDAAAGLDAIHNATDLDGKPLGLVHRDVSPQNILLGLDGVARVADFGIAKGASDKGHTGPTMRRGKFGYMSPEYIKMRVTNMSSDMFALGVVLWEALAGRRLFEGPTGLDSIKLAMAAEVPSLREINGMVSNELDAFVQRALSRSPLDRFGSMRHFGDELEAIGEGGLIAKRSDVSRFVAQAIAAREKGTTTAKTASGKPAPIQTLASVDVELDAPESRRATDTGSGERPARTSANNNTSSSGTTDIEIADVELVDGALASASAMAEAMKGDEVEVEAEDTAESSPPSLTAPLSRFHQAFDLEQVFMRIGENYAVKSESSSGTIVASPISGTGARRKVA